LPPEKLLDPAEVQAARRLARDAYFEELRKARQYAQSL
jgi:hypothetical protein